MEVYAAYGLGVGLGVGSAYVPAVGAVQRWFVQHRGFASGLAVSGIGVGTLVMPPLAALLINALGWRSAYWSGVSPRWSAAGMALLIEDDPAKRGLAPDGDAAGRRRRGERGGATVASPSVGAIRPLYVASLICSFGLFVPFVHWCRTPSITACRDPRRCAAGAIGVGSTAGRFFSAASPTTWDASIPC